MSSLSRWTSTTALLFALSGVLIATSIFNIGESGIAFFWVLFPLVAFRLLFRSGWLPSIYGDKKSFDVLMLTAAVAIALFATTVLHIVVEEREPSSELVHLISRLSFLVYFVVAERLLRGEIVDRTLVWIRRLLLVVCAYGAYQLPAKLLGMPLFLDWLRNNRSLLMYDYNEAGWIGIARANSIYAEPSQATVPILVLLILNIHLDASKTSKVLGWIVLVLFAVATFSRTAWIVVATAIIAWLWSRSRHALALSLLGKRRSLLITGTLILFLVLPFWGLIEANSDGDLSAQERSGGIVVGLNSIKDAPLLGHGWNSFADVARRYSDIPIFLDPQIDFGFIHNMIISYVQQAGLSGLLLAALPFFLLIYWSTAPPWITYSTLASFLIAAEFGGDIGYSSLTWLWIALLINMKTASQANRSVLNDRRHLSPQSYRNRMSVAPSSSS
jgi:O-antigen ligase